MSDGSGMNSIGAGGHGGSHEGGIGGLRDRLAGGAEDKVGKALTELLDSSLLSGAIGRAFDARERAAQAQEVAMSALNIPSAADLERLTRRLRSVSQRLDGLEELLHRHDRGTVARLSAVEEQLRELAGMVASLSATAESLVAADAPTPTAKSATAKPSTAAAKPSTAAQKPSTAAQKPSTVTAKPTATPAKPTATPAKLSATTKPSAPAKPSAAADPRAAMANSPTARAQRSRTTKPAGSSRSGRRPRRSPSTGK